MFQTVRFKNELERNITIKLGYANAKVSGNGLRSRNHGLKIILLQLTGFPPIKKIRENFETFPIREKQGVFSQNLGKIFKSGKISNSG